MGGPELQWLFATPNWGASTVRLPLGPMSVLAQKPVSLEVGKCFPLLAAPELLADAAIAASRVAS